MNQWLSGALPGALAAACLIGLLCGIFGSFLVVRRMALAGDMLAHAVLPGVVAGLAWSASRQPLLVLACAVTAGWLGSATLRLLLRRTRLKPDAALALVLSVFFAAGIALISRYQPSGVQAFLFGQIAAVDRADLALAGAAALIACGSLPWWFRPLRLASFDPSFARLIGLPLRALEAGFFFALAVVIVIAMQAVGVILVTAMLVTPATSARYFCARLGPMVALASAIGCAGAVLGLWLSTTRPGLPSGPVVVLALAAGFALAALFGPRGGWLPGLLRRQAVRRRIAAEDFLKARWHDAHSPAPAGKTLLRTLRKNAWLDEAGQLTRAGRDHAARLVRRHRLWETYLTRHAAKMPGVVHEEAERAEHWIDERQHAELTLKLGDPETDPHGSPIPPDPGAPSSAAAADREPS